MLDCFSEHCALTLDLKFSCSKKRSRKFESTDIELEELWEYYQDGLLQKKILGFENISAKYESNVEDYLQKDKELFPKIVIVIAEARLQVELVYALNAVAQYMNW